MSVKDNSCSWVFFSFWQSTWQSAILVPLVRWARELAKQVFEKCPKIVQSVHSALISNIWRWSSLVVNLEDAINRHRWPLRSRFLNLTWGTYGCINIPVLITLVYFVVELFFWWVVVLISPNHSAVWCVTKDIVTLADTIYLAMIKTPLFITRFTKQRAQLKITESAHFFGLFEFEQTVFTRIVSRAFLFKQDISGLLLDRKCIELISHRSQLRHFIRGY